MFGEHYCLKHMDGKKHPFNLNEWTPSVKLVHECHTRIATNKYTGNRLWNTCLYKAWHLFIFHGDDMYLQDDLKATLSQSKKENPRDRKTESN